jgi:e3 binding domain
MAQQTKRRASRKGEGSGSKRSQSKRRAPRKSGQGGGGSNGSEGGSRRSPLRNQTDESTVPEREYQDYTQLHPGSISDTDEPDVLVDIPVVKVDEIHFELDQLEARVALHAEVLDLVKLSVGVHAELGRVELSISGVEAQALLRARLDHVTAIIDRVLTTLDRNPKLLESIGRSLEKVGAGAGKGVGQIGQGAGHAVEDVGEGAEGAVQDVGKGVQGLGQGAGGAVGALGQGAAGGGGGNGGGGAGQGGNGLTAKLLAKEAAKTVVKEIGAAATDEAKDLGLAATHKAMELGERRRQRRAMKHHATDAAMRKAEAAGIDLEEIEGSGAEGRITVRDVEGAGSG